MNKPLALERDISFHWSPVGGKGVGDSCTVEFWEDSVVLFYRETLFVGVSRDMWKEALETVISLHSSPAGKPGGNSFTGDFERRTKEALQTERLSLWEFCEGTLEGRLLYWVFWRIYTGRLWKRASVSTGTRWATWRGMEVIYRGLWEIVQEGY